MGPSSGVRWWPTSGRWAAAVTVSLLVAACGAGPGRNGTPAGGSDPTAVDDGTTGTQPSPADGGGGGGDAGGDDGDGGGGGGDGDDGFAWTGWGPSDPPIPGQYLALASSPPACDDAEAQAPPGDGFWQTVVTVCRAVNEGGPWPSGAAVPGPPEADNAYQRCLDEELVQMLGRAMQWHADNPGRQPDVARAGDDATSDCQTRIYEVGLVDDQGADLDGEALAIMLAVAEQDQGVPLPVRVGGTEVEHADEVFVDGPQGVGMTTVVVVVPADLLDGSVDVEVTTARGVLTVTADITAEEAPEPAEESEDGAEDGAEESAVPAPGEEPEPSPGPSSEPSGGSTGP